MSLTNLDSERDDWGMVDNKAKLEEDIKRQQTMAYMKAQKEKLNIVGVNKKSVMSAVGDLYI
jgi:hypothetical protein